jgi:uncharacterized protein (DUF1330 family)
LFYTLDPAPELVSRRFARQGTEVMNEGVSGARLIGEGFQRFQKINRLNPCVYRKTFRKYIVQGVQPTTIEGDWKPERMVIIEFPDREKAEAFLSDPEIQDLFKVRHATKTSRLVLADGCT